MSKTIDVIMTETRVIPQVGVRVRGEVCEFDKELGEQLLQQGCALPYTKPPSKNAGKSEE